MSEFSKHMNLLQKIAIMNTWRQKHEISQRWQLLRNLAEFAHLLFKCYTLHFSYVSTTFLNVKALYCFKKIEYETSLLACSCRERRLLQSDSLHV